MFYRWCGFFQFDMKWRRLLDAGVDQYSALGEHHINSGRWTVRGGFSWNTRQYSCSTEGKTLEVDSPFLCALAVRSAAHKSSSADPSKSTRPRFTKTTQFITFIIYNLYRQHTPASNKDSYRTLRINKLKESSPSNAQHQQLLSSVRYLSICRRLFRIFQFSFVIVTDDAYKTFNKRRA